VFVWQVIDVSSWEVSLEEVRGLRVKQWLIAPDGSQWLRKEPRAMRPYEPPIEMLVLQLARAAGVPAAEATICQWTDGSAPKRGLAVRSFVDRTREQLVAGTLLLSRHDAQYHADAKWQHSLERVRAVLSNLESAGGIGLLLDFTRMLAFDAWIGNGDRHQDNWSVLLPEDGSRCSLAPMYDPAACLGTELQDGHMQLDPQRRTSKDLERYIKQCPSGFGDGRAAIKLAHVVETIRQWPEWQQNSRSWVAAFRNAFNNLVSVLPNVDPAWLPEHRKLFMTTLLEERLNWLEKERT
jgi:hypothetical protein